MFQQWKIGYNEKTLRPLGGELQQEMLCPFVYIQGPPKKCIHTLTKENSMLYVSNKFNYTSQVEYKVQ